MRKIVYIKVILKILCIVLFISSLTATLILVAFDIYSLYLAISFGVFIITATLSYLYPLIKDFSKNYFAIDYWIYGYVLLLLGVLYFFGTNPKFTMVMGVTAIANLIFSINKKRQKNQ